MRSTAALILVSLAALLAALALCSGAEAASLGGFNKPDQRLLSRAGWMEKAKDGRFHGERAMSVGATRHALAQIAAERDIARVRVPGGAMTVERFNLLVVRQLGLADAARRVRSEAGRAGLSPRQSFGYEVIARQLGLRYNHPFEDDRLELYPWQRITRAEAAYTLVRVYKFHGFEESYARGVSYRFQLPRYSRAQKRVLRVAISKVGMPYIWGGETDHKGSWFGWQAQGGYDCSGLVWRAFKMTGNPVGERIRGRTAAAMAGEMRRSSRIRMSAIRPADLLFFGPARFSSRASEAGITHVGIALSKEFMVHSSSQGVYISPLFERWRQKNFSWARRVL